MFVNRINCFLDKKPYVFYQKVEKNENLLDNPL